MNVDEPLVNFKRKILFAVFLRKRFGLCDEPSRV